MPQRRDTVVTRASAARWSAHPGDRWYACGVGSHPHNWAPALLSYLRYTPLHDHVPHLATADTDEADTDW